MRENMGQAVDRGKDGLLCEVAVIRRVGMRTGAGLEDRMKEGSDRGGVGSWIIVTTVAFTACLG